MMALDDIFFAEVTPKILGVIPIEPEEVPAFCFRELRLLGAILFPTNHACSLHFDDACQILCLTSLTA